jgi:hypothetical protein
MKDDFDNGMGMPDEELTGGSSLSDMADITAGSLEGDLLGELEEPGSRPSGGARARKAAFVPRARSAAKVAKAAKPVKKKIAKAKKVAKKAAKKKGARKAKPARKGSSKKRARAGKKK